MTDAANPEQDDSEGNEYDPFEYVPERIDGITASGLEQLHDALEPSRQANLRSVEVETQAAILWDLVEKGAISLDITSRQEASR